MDESTLRRFMEKVDRTGECWIWTAATRNGYGKINVGGRTRDAHRLSFEHHHRLLAPGEYVLHGCDEPRCVNPEHLRAGTQADNMREMAERGRSTKGRPRPDLTAYNLERAARRPA